jgi:polysaccharide pyruvyl transferase WcaK-like protein
VGINAFPHYDSRYWPESNPTAYNRYVSNLAGFTVWLLQHEYTVVFFPTQFRADPPVIQDVKNAVTQSGNPHPEDQLIEISVRSVEDLLKLLALTDLVVATRFHGIVLPFLMNKPVVALSNHHKMADLMLDMGQADYLLNIDTFTSEALIERFKFLELNRDAVSCQIARKIMEYRIALDGQYDAVLDGLVGSDCVARQAEVTS